MLSLFKSHVSCVWASVNSIDSSWMKYGLYWSSSRDSSNKLYSYGGFLSIDIV